jgi:hypothetical protein
MHSEVERYPDRARHHRQEFPHQGRGWGHEVTFRGERKKLKGLVKDLRGEALDDSWKWDTFH